MKKHKKKLLFAVVALAILIIGSFKAYDILSGYIFRMLAEEQLNEMLDEGEITLDQLLPEQPAEADSTEPKSNINSDSEPSDIPEQVHSEENPNESTTEKPPAKPPAKPKAQIVKEKAAEIEKATTESERSEIMKLISSRLSPSEISYLMGFLSGGLTAEEKTKAKKIAYEKFTAGEIQKIREYYRKYIGLIQ